MNLIIKGFVIGIGKIIPGVSGAMLAMTLGVYEKILYILANIKKELMNNMDFIIKLGIGAILSIILTSKIIVNCLNNYYFPTMLLFIGMITGEIPSQIKKTKLSKKNIIIAIIIIITIIIIFNNIDTNHHQKVLEINKIEFIKLIGVGIIDAISCIIPGISGTALLMSIGYYNIILQTFSNLLNISKIKSTLFIMPPFIIGFFIGIIMTSKILNYMFKKNKELMNMLILILVIVTTITLTNITFSSSFTNLQLITGMILFIFGFKITKIFDK